METTTTDPTNAADVHGKSFNDAVNLAAQWMKKHR
jgi:hypothetical protein